MRTRKFETVVEKLSTFNSITLQTNGLTPICIEAEKRIGDYEVTYPIDQKTNKRYKAVSRKLIDEEKLKIEKVTYPLVEVSSDEIDEYRKKRISFLVLKVQGKYYFTEIPKNMNFLSANILGMHMCAKIGHECKRLSAASDENGGCQKIRDINEHINKYPWITDGFETYNTVVTVFKVAKCEHYEKCAPRK